MKKHWRKFILGGLVLLALLTAWATWLGYLPFARPGNEEDFMEEQLRRVRYAGPLRTEHEVAMAERLPENPDLDDLRIAFFRHRLALYAELARAVTDAYPEYADAGYPPTDHEARARYVKLASECAALETEYVLDYGEPSLGDRVDEFLDATAELSDTLVRCVPANGKMLLQVDPHRPYEIELMPNSVAPFRIAVARALVLIEQQQSARAIQEFHGIAKCSHTMSWCPGLLGQLLYVVCTGVVYEKGVLPIAEKGLATPAWLTDLGDSTLMPKVDPIESMVAEYRMMFAMHTNPSSENWEGSLELDVARLHTGNKFDEFGPTSLNDWIARENIDEDNWDAVIQRLEQLRRNPVDFTDASDASSFFTTAYGSSNEAHWDQANQLAQIATAMVETEGLMVAAQLHAARISSPDTWIKSAHDLAEAHPYLLIEASGDTVQIRANTDHPSIKRGSTDDRVLATVR